LKGHYIQKNRFNSEMIIQRQIKDNENSLKKENNGKAEEEHENTY
jgi:hypothetical protein